MIEWNKVTWYSKIVAGILFVITFYIGFILGKQAGEIPILILVPQTSITGCYVAHMANDVYKLNIQSQYSGMVSGTLAFNTAEKDTSSGTFSGTYTDGILLGDYSFISEGTESIRQVIFKKEGNLFVEGFGTVTVVGNRESFTAPINVTYNTKGQFVSSPASDCAQY